jgi:hypothetical protein
VTKPKTAFDVIQQLSSDRDYSYDEETNQLYAPFLINRGMSNFYDVIMLANEMNSMAVSKVPKKWAFDFYHHAIKVKRKRFAPWAKPRKDERVKIISDAYKCSKTIAEQYNRILTEDDIKDLEDRMFKGGR